MTEIRITVNNTSDTGGTFLTPVWFGFHDNSFDLFNPGEAASAGLETIAEDGDAAGLGAELVAADADGQGGIVPGAAGPISTREQTSTTLNVNGASNAYLSLAAMLLPSNDAFIGTGEAVEVFDDAGNFLGAQVVEFLGTDVYDAGTEVNTELDAAFINQTGPNTGIDENGVVRLHPGFNGSLGNPVGEGDQIILGGTNAFGEFIDPVVADFTQPGAEVASVHINTVNREEGTSGQDVLLGGDDDDIFTGGNGSDLLSGRAGYDVLSGGSGADFLFGGRGNDELDGGSGADLLVGNSGRDTLLGGEGTDKIFAGSGDDTIDGGDQRDTLFGGSGNDVISGGAGRDVILGGSGDDFIFGGTGSDFIVAGPGDDTIAYGTGDGFDTIRGFGTGDTLLLSVEGVAAFEDVLAAATETFFGVRLDFGAGNRILLSGADLGDLEASLFDFA
ncbi:MAG: spondin domain-containing protein [Pseudomonadota bacterium]